MNVFSFTVKSNCETFDELDQKSATANNESINSFNNDPKDSSLSAQSNCKTLNESDHKLVTETEESKSLNNDPSESVSFSYSLIFCHIYT